MKRNQIVFFSNLILSLVILTFLNIERDDVLFDTVSFLNSIQIYPTTLSFNIIDTIIIAFIPLWSSVFYLKFEKIKLKNIILINIIVFFSLLLLVIISFFIGDVLGPKLSPLIPEYVINVPFDNYVTFSLLVGVILIFILHYFFIKNNVKLNSIK